MAALMSNGGQIHGRGIDLFVVSILFCFIATCLVVVRVYSRGGLGKKLGADDIVIIFSLFFSIALSVANCISVDHGYGKKQATLPAGDDQTALQAFLVCQVVYKCTINLTKISICLLYLRIFTTVKWFRKAVYAILAFVLLYAVASILATIFQCLPVSRFWDHSINGQCINITRFWYTNAAASIFSDFVILLLPMPVVRDLQLPSRQRWGLALVFGLGVFVCITSILRMITLDTSSKAPDATYGTLPSTVWTTVEANIGIICACLPMLKTPLAAVFPKLFPRGSYREYSGGSARRPRCPSLPHHASSMAYNGWGRYIEMEPSQRSMRISGHTVTGSTPPGQYSSHNSSNPAFCMNGNDVPLGQIAKTTHVNVQYADKNYPPQYSPLDNYHTKDVSNPVSPAISYA